MYKFIVSLLIFSLALCGCEKNYLNDAVEAASLTANAVVPISFEWDKVDYMPTPIGFPRILVPWASNVNQAFPPEFLTDYSSGDGWELVYNTFNTTTVDQPLFFALYNKYRGVLRLFAYLNPITPIPSNYISHALEMREPWDSPILNFSSQEIVRADTLQTRGNQIQPYHTSATGTWYGCQFEIAYDPNINTREAITSMLTWRLSSVAISQMVLNGTTSGEVTGTMTQPAPSGQLFPMIVGSVMKGAAMIGTGGALTALKLGAAVTAPISGALSSGAQGQVTNILSGILGGKSATTYQVDLKINADHEFTGSSTDYYNINAITLATPGTLNQNTLAGYLPLYNKPMGVFSLRTIPLVKGKYIRKAFAKSRVQMYRVEEDFYLDTSTVVIDFNPAIINTNPDGASIQNIRKQLVIYAIKENKGIGDKIDNIDRPLADGSYSIETFNGVKFAVLPFTSKIPQELKESSIRESDGDRYDYDRLKYLYGRVPDAERFSIMRNEYLRIIFDVVPNNGDPRSTIVKTFKLKWDGDFEDESL